MDRKVPYILTEAFLLMPDSFEISISLVSVNATPNGVVRASFRQDGISGIEVFDSRLEAPADSATQDSCEVLRPSSRPQRN